MHVRHIWSRGQPLSNMFMYIHWKREQLVQQLCNPSTSNKHDFGQGSWGLRPPRPSAYLGSIDCAPWIWSNMRPSEVEWARYLIVYGPYMTVHGPYSIIYGPYVIICGPYTIFDIFRRSRVFVIQRSQFEFRGVDHWRTCVPETTLRSICAPWNIVYRPYTMLLDQRSRSPRLSWADRINHTSTLF